jgi:hypothetical protein
LARCAGPWTRPNTCGVRKNEPKKVRRSKSISIVSYLIFAFFYSRAGGTFCKWWSERLGSVELSWCRSSWCVLNHGDSNRNCAWVFVAFTHSAVIVWCEFDRFFFHLVRSSRSYILHISETITDSIMTDVVSVFLVVLFLGACYYG